VIFAICYTISFSVQLSDENIFRHSSCTCIEHSVCCILYSLSLNVFFCLYDMLKVPEHTEYKIISTTYKLLQFSSPQYLRDTITIQPSRSTRSSDLVTLLHPPVQSCLRITNRSFRHAAPQLWNKLPHSLRVPYHSGSSLSSLCPQAPTLNLLSTCLMVCSILGSIPISAPSVFLLCSPLSHGLITW